MKNYAVVFPERHKSDIIEVPMPEVQDNHILVSTNISMISTGTEMTGYTGEFPAGSVWDRINKLPIYPGYNSVGTVIDVGKNIDKSWIGKRVAVPETHRKYYSSPIWNDMTVKGHVYKDSYQRCLEVPEWVSDEEAAFFAFPQIVMNGIRRSGLIWGEKVVIFGAGLLGQFAARFCALAGGLPVFVSDPSEFRLGLLPNDPAIIKINPTKENVPEVIKAHCNGELADVAFEITGRAEFIHGEIQALRRSGRLLVLSSTRDKVEFDFHDDCCYPSVQIIGSHCGSSAALPQVDWPWTCNEHVKTYFNMLKYKKIDINPLISKMLPYDRAPELYKDLDENRGAYMGMFIDWR